MREILFRAKRINDGEWVSGGSFITFFDNGVKSFFMPQFNEKCTCEHDEITDDILSFSECRFYKVDPETICQFTGMYDKSGNKIWENDIVKDFVNGDVYSCKWNHSNCEYELWNDKESFGLGYAALYNYQVMGTIFDDSELLKGGI